MNDVSPLWCANDEPHAAHSRWNEFNGIDYCTGRPSLAGDDVKITRYEGAGLVVSGHDNGYTLDVSEKQYAALRAYFAAEHVEGGAILPGNSAERVPEDWSNGESFILHARVPEDVQALVDEARLWPRDGINEGPLINELADALVSVSAERDALAAVIEEARALARPGQSVPLGVSEWMHADSLLSAMHQALSRVPSEVLSERDAKVRAEVIDWIDDESDENGAQTPGEATAHARMHFGLTKGADRG